MEELSHSENLKFSAEICLRVRIPPPAPASPSRPVPLIEERGDFLRSVRRFDGFTPAPNHNMRFSPFHAFLPIQSLNHDMRLPPPHQSPRLPYRFSVPPHRIALFDPPCRTTIRLGGTRCRCPPSRVSFPIGGEARPRSSTRFSIRPIGFSPSSSPRFPPGGSASPLLSAFLYGRRGGYVFFARISFSRRFRRDM